MLRRATLREWHCGKLCAGLYSLNCAACGGPQVDVGVAVPSGKQGKLCGIVRRQDVAVCVVQDVVTNGRQLELVLRKILGKSLQPFPLCLYREGSADCQERTAYCGGAGRGSLGREALYFLRVDVTA